MTDANIPWGFGRRAQVGTQYKKVPPGNVGKESTEFAPSPLSH